MSRFKIIIMSFVLAISLSMFTAITPSIASAAPIDISYEPGEDGCYYETVIEASDSVFSVSGAKTTKTGSKITSYKNSSGQVLWYVKVTGTFTYGGGSSSCTKVSATAKAEHVQWKVSNIKSSKSGSTAKASAKGTKYSASGAVISSAIRTVSLTCSASGALS